MFETLTSAIDELDPPVSLDAARSLLALRDQLDAKLHSLVADIDAAGLWDLDAATSLTGWLKAAGETGPRAHRMTKLVHRLRSLPALAEAWETGTLSSAQVEVIAGNITTAT